MFKIFQPLESRIENLEEEINDISEQLDIRRDRLAHEFDTLDALRKQFNRLVS